MTLQKPTASPPAHRLARNVKNQTLLLWVVAIESLGLIASPLYWNWKESQARNLLIFDPVSAAIVSAPVIDPTRSTDMVDLESRWSAQCILNRSENGLDLDRFIPPLFLEPAAKAVRAEYAAQKNAFQEKHMTSTLRVASVNAEYTGKGTVVSTVNGKVLITGVANNGPFQDEQDITLRIEFHRSPALSTERHYYPLVVYRYSYHEVPATPPTASR